MENVTDDTKACREMTFAERRGVMQRTPGENQAQLLHLFDYDRLDPDLFANLKPFGDLAINIVNFTEPGPEQAMALRKLLESRDCVQRQVILARA